MTGCKLCKWSQRSSTFSTAKVYVTNARKRSNRKLAVTLLNASEMVCYSPSAL